MDIGQVVVQRCRDMEEPDEQEITSQSQADSETVSSKVGQTEEGEERAEREVTHRVQ